MARVLGRVRLSLEKQESTSVARQKQYITDWATSQGHTVIGWAIDVNTSGSISPFKTKQFGEWLNKRADEFDIIACWKMDRLSRRTVHSYALMAWCKENGKQVKATNDDIDPMSRVGELIWFILAWLGEGELEAIRERSQGSYEYLVSVGRWRGGRVPYGYRPVRAEAGWRLEIDEEAAERLREMVRRITAGESTRSVIEDYSARGVLSPPDQQRYNHNLTLAPGEKPKEIKGSKWDDTSIYDMLRSRRMLGQWESKGKLVRDEEGMPLQFAEPLISHDEWYALQERLKSNQITQTQRKDSNALLGIGFCGKCEHQLYSNTGRGGKRYYGCGSRTKDNYCGERSFSALELEEIIEEGFLSKVGDLEVVRKRFVPGSNRTEELTQLKEAMATLMHDLTGMSSQAGKTILMEQIGALDERIASLEAEPSFEDHWVDESQGESYAELWGRLGTQERARLLRETGVRALARRVEGRPVCAVVLPPDLEERVKAHQVHGE